MTRLLVTGARQGLGLELVRQSAAGTDWDIIATCLEPDSAADLQAVAGSSEGRVSVRELDVDNHAEVDALAASLSGTAIDILVNNAGIKGPEVQDFGSLDYDRWTQVLHTNLLGPMKMAEAFVDHVAASDQKLIVTLASGTGSMEYNHPDTRGPGPGGLIYYRTSKAGVNMITRNLAHELRGRGIAVLALAPGHVRTEMGGPEAPLSVEESVAGMLKVISSAGMAQSGSFLLFDGSTYPW